MTTKTGTAKRHLRAVRSGEDAQTASEALEHAGDGQGATDGLSALSARRSDGADEASAASGLEVRSAPPEPPQVNGHDVKVWEVRANHVLQAIQAQGAVIPPAAMEQLRAQAQIVAALRILVNHLGVPEVVVQAAEAQAMHQLLSAVLIQVEAGAVARRQPQVQPVRGPGLIVPGRR